MERPTTPGTRPSQHSLPVAARARVARRANSGYARGISGEPLDVGQNLVLPQTLHVVDDFIRIP